ncbi:unnamed protein product, partial [Prorocentrum cordatum]
KGLGPGGSAAQPGRGERLAAMGWPLWGSPSPPLGGGPEQALVQDDEAGDRRLPRLQGPQVRRRRGRRGAGGRGAGGPRRRFGRAPQPLLLAALYYKDAQFRQEVLPGFGGTGATLERGSEFVRACY